MTCSCGSKAVTTDETDTITIEQCSECGELVSIFLVAWF